MKMSPLPPPPHLLSDAEKIAQHFGQNAAGYDKYACLQKETAQRLAALLPSAKAVSSVLELGCGTGFLSQLLLKRYPHARLMFTDLSASMLEVCQQNTRLSPLQPNLSFAQLDAAQPTLRLPSFDLIVSSMTFQWLHDPISSLKAWQQKLTPTGRLYYCAPAPGSFPQWQHVLKTLDLPSGLLKTPDFPGQTHKTAYIHHYTNALHFFSELRATGANLPRPGYQPLRPGQLRTALHMLDRQGLPLKISWEIQYGYIEASRKIHF